MDEHLENEFLTQVAAGTDPLTALAALEQDKPKRGLGFWIVFFIALAVLLYVFWS